MSQSSPASHKLAHAGAGKAARKYCLTFLAVFLGWTAAGSAAETAVQITPDLRGAWVVPDKDWDGRAVLLLHGFASDLDDAGGLLKRLAGELAAQGIASLRINFRGEGDATRTNIESTLTTRLEDTAAAREFVAQQPGAAVGRIGVLGFSLGGSTAIVTGGRHPAWFRSMCVWSSPGGDQFAFMAEGIFGAAFAQAKREGSGSMLFNNWKTVTIRREFFESFRGINLDESLAKYPGAFMTVRGTRDFLPQHDEVFLRIAPGRTVQKAIIEGADHIFNVFQPELGHAAQAIGLTVTWFARTR